MDEMRQLLRDYLDGKLASEDFVMQYIKLADQIRDEVWQAFDKKPWIKEEIRKLAKQLSQGQITSQACFEERERLVSQLEPTRVVPFSREDEVLSHLYVEADAYEEDPQYRVEGLNIGEDELRAEVQKALDVLTGANDTPE